MSAAPEETSQPSEPPNDQQAARGDAQQPMKPPHVSVAESSAEYLRRLADEEKEARYRRERSRRFRR